MCMCTNNSEPNVQMFFKIWHKLTHNLTSICFYVKDFDCLASAVYIVLHKGYKDLLNIIF